MALRGLDAVVLPPTAHIQVNIEKLRTLERQIEVSTHVARLKGEVLNILDWAKNGRPPKVDLDLPINVRKGRRRRLRTAEDVEYLNITGRDAILGRAREAQASAKALGLSDGHTSVADRMAVKLDELAQLDSEISLFATKGRSLPCLICGLTGPSPRTTATVSGNWFYESQRPGFRRAADMVNRRMRMDYIRLPGGQTEKIAVTGENVSMLSRRGLRTSWETPLPSM